MPKMLANPVSDGVAYVDELVSTPNALSASATVAANRSGLITQPFTLSNPYTTDVLADVPNVYLKLNETSGNFADISGNGQVGTPAGGVTYGVAGATADEDTAVTLNGSTGKITVPDGPLTDLGDVFTLECWIKRAVTTGGTTSVFSKDTNAYQLRFNSDNTIALRQQGFNQIAASTVTIADTSWHHVVVTKSGSTVKIYIDGVDRTGAVTDHTLVDTSSALLIGTASGGTFFNGSIDEVAIYTTALSAARVLSHFNSAALAATKLTMATGSRLAVVG